MHVQRVVRHPRPSHTLKEIPMRNDYFPGDSGRRHHDHNRGFGRPVDAGHGDADARFRRHHGDPADHRDQHDHHAHGGPGDAGFGGFGPRDFGRRGFGPQFDPRGFDPAMLAAFGGRGRRRASRGDIRAAILSLLGDGPKNGYTLIKAIAEKTDGLWKPSPGSVYPTLQQLVDEDLVAPTGDGKGTEYELTEAGRSYVAENETELAAAWKAAPSRSEADATLHDAIGRLMGVVHQFRFAATDDQRRVAAEKIDELRKALYLILAE
jgi:DNA-binding PadR family transcriptional regulator